MSGYLEHRFVFAVSQPLPLSGVKVKRGEGPRSRSAGGASSEVKDVSPGADGKNSTHVSV